MIWADGTVGGPSLIKEMDDGRKEKGGRWEKIVVVVWKEGIGRGLLL